MHTTSHRTVKVFFAALTLAGVEMQNFFMTKRSVKKKRILNPDIIAPGCQFFPPIGWGEGGLRNKIFLMVGKFSHSGV